jgi:hypothetical protein
MGILINFSVSGVGEFVQLGEFSLAVMGNGFYLSSGHGRINHCIT